MAPQAQDELLAGRYRRLRTIGVGGMARVHLAEDERLGRRVAVKQMHADSPDEVRLRFEREAKLGASLNHPNLVSIFDIESDSESVLIVMEYVEGETLQDAIARGTLPVDRVRAILGDVAAGLDHAHAHGVVHRDVKPANVLIRHDGVAKLADLGIASAAEQTSITRSGIVMGTAAYMAPEQLEGGVATPRTDVYALAAVAYEALAGEKARSGRTPVEVAHEMVNGAPPDLARSWPDAPPAAAAALRRGMARHPADRPASAGELASELDRALSGRPATAPTAPVAATEPTRPVATARPSSQRRGWLPVAVAALVALAVAAVAFGALDGGDGDPGASRETATAPPDGSSGERGGSGADGPAPSASADESGSAAPATPTSPEPADPEPVAGGDDPVALNDEGYGLMQDGRYDEAIPLLERAVAAFPEGSQELTYAYALYNLGRSLRLAGRPDEAIPVLERRLEIPNQTDTVQRELDAARAAAG